MPALPPVNKVVRCVLTLADASDLHTLNRIFISYSGTAPTDAQLAAFANSVGANWGAHLKSSFDTSSLLEIVTCEDLTSNTGATGSANPGILGTRAGVTLSAAAAAVVSFSILRRYRGGHPRSYLAAGVQSDLQTKQTWTNGFATGLASAYAAFIVDTIASGWAAAGTLAQVNVSYFSGFTNHTYPSGRTRPIPTPRVTPVVDPILAVRVNTTVGSQRRRNLQSV
jgi:hypothetical protein